MGKTKITVNDRNFFINGKLTYSEIPETKVSSHGLLMNARFIQGIFDDKADRSRFNRFGLNFDPERNTDDLIAALPQWYEYGLRAFTVGLQGGGPCFTIRNDTINNNPYSNDGTTVDQAYLNRLDRLIIAADDIGMAVIVSCLYPGQVNRIKDDNAVMNAIKAVANHLRDKGYTNIIIEPCNEYNIRVDHPIVCTDEGMLRLLRIAKNESGGMLVGCSGTGGYICKEVIEFSDVVLIHGNSQTRNRLAQLIRRARLANQKSPIVVNEDSQDITNITVCEREHVSWGYYNNLTKQEPPARWGVLPGEDYFFACRVAETVGISYKIPDVSEQILLLGMEPEISSNTTADSVMAGRLARFHPELKIENGTERWLRIGALYPEKIDFVEFFIDGNLLETVYDTPYLTNMISNWLHAPTVNIEKHSNIHAAVHMRDGSVRTVTV